MNQLISISPPDPNLDMSSLDDHRVEVMPVVVMFPHNQCDCHCVMCDIWKIRDAEELSVSDLERQMPSLRRLGVKWIVFSGGEPQKSSQLPVLAGMLRDEGIRVTLLTAGLLLDSQAELIAATMDDVIVSLDGPPALHNRIRRVPRAFERLADGVKELRRRCPDIRVSARCTVQKLNHCSLRATAISASDIGLSSISFLAADFSSSSAFNRPALSATEPQDELQEKIALNPTEVEELAQEVQRLIHEHSCDIASGFIAESAKKLERIVLHFRAGLGQSEPVAPRCNAPWVSAVVEANGDVRPCFFHRVLGNTRHQTLDEIVNSPQALQFRKNLDIATDPICRQCVCSLHIPDARAFDATPAAAAIRSQGGRNG